MVLAVSGKSVSLLSLKLPTSVNSSKRFKVAQFWTALNYLLYYLQKQVPNRYFFRPLEKATPSEIVLRGISVIPLGLAYLY